MTAPFRGPASAARTLRGRVPFDFEEFYRAELRFVAGRRVRATDVAARYEEWAALHAARSLGRRDLKRAMLSIGHGSVKSSRMFYRDAAFAADVPDLPDNYPAPRDADELASEPAAFSIVAEIDRTMRQLERLRGKVATL